MMGITLLMIGITFRDNLTLNSFLSIHYYPVPVEILGPTTCGGNIGPSNPDLSL